MKTVRRLYFYAVAFISVEVVLWGLIGLLRSIVGDTVGGQAETLARALALVVVGVPIFLFHWMWAQRAAERDPEEQTAALRAVFLYGVLISTLIPVAQNVLALIDRVFLDAGRLQLSRAIMGHAQSWEDSLIAILMNGVVAAYFWNVLHGEWPGLPDRKNFADVRRLYRYAWLLYSLLMAIIGAQQVLNFLFFTPTDVLGNNGRESLINGISLLLVGAPIWAYTWRVIQGSQDDPAEHDSNLRLGVLYLLALGGVIAVLTAATVLVSVLVKQVLGAGLPADELLRRVGGPISVGVPLGAVWAYYGQWLNRHIDSIGDEVRQAGMKRLHLYVLSALGLGGAFVGVAMLVKFLIDYLTGNVLALSDTLRSSLSSGVALLAAWLPLWLLTWRPLQEQALANDDRGDHARRSILRRAYLYLALFAGVVGGMASAAALLFEVLKRLLGGGTDSDLLPRILNDLQLLVLFAILLVYHLQTMRRDGQARATALAERHGRFRVAVLDGADGFGEAFRAALAKAAPGVPLTVGSEKPEGEFEALVLSGSRALDAPEWARSFHGTRIVVPDEAAGVVWAGGLSEEPMQKAAQAVRQLAEGQSVRQKPPGQAWRIVVYVAAALFGLELLFMLLGFVLSAFLSGAD